MSSQTRNHNSPNLARMPSNMLPEYEVKFIEEHLDRGFTAEYIAECLVNSEEGSRKQSRQRRVEMYIRHANKVAADRYNWSTYRSIPGMTLAYLGNARAFEELTFFERRDVAYKVYNEHYIANRTHPAFPEHDGIEGAGLWAKKVGLHREWFSRDGRGRRDPNESPSSRYSNKMTLEKAREMRKMRAETNMPVSELAVRFGVAASTAHRVLSGRSWVEPDTQA